MTKLPTYLDRYPAKMVSRLATRLVTDFAGNATSLLDPFCGSGAVLFESVNRGIESHGIDLNPYGVLLTKVKIEGFDSNEAKRIWSQVKSKTERKGPEFPVAWEGKDYWFTARTLYKYERLRAVLRQSEIGSTQTGRAILLAYALSIRRCSRADQRSPKPFISKTARLKRSGKHFDPIVEIEALLCKLIGLYGQRTGHKALLHCEDVVNPKTDIGRHSHVITSPPYINAQDYFRNFKLELHLLAGLLDFSVAEIKERFIGTERGDVACGIPRTVLESNAKHFKKLQEMRDSHSRAAAVVDRYFWDMGRAMQTISEVLINGGTFVLVCGDNLVAGQRIPTWRILNSMAENNGLVLREQFGDKIECRNLPPKRNGHKGLIKQEVVSVFTKPR